MKVPFSHLKPGDKFKFAGAWHVKVYGFGIANCGDIELHTFACIPFEAMVEVPPFTEEDYAPTPDEIAQQAEHDAKGDTMLKRVLRGDLDHPLDKEQDE